ncbi:hypothetical protein CFter6_3362 [Collimonas fungivorans]|uniref:Uncharacterized protein n=1 Tax=Collimonas fungivorans TaxID=158899 RepID=A0A127PDW5_9BURK|nr:hypothetical protein CFter6_3362 [Collimonas fungivorans]
MESREILTSSSGYDDISSMKELLFSRLSGIAAWLHHQAPCLPMRKNAMPAGIRYRLLEKVSI